MIINEILNYITNKYDGVVIKNSYKELAIFYNPNNLLKNGVYVCTIKEQDGNNDKASKLFRNGVFRFSCGLTKDDYINLFKILPKRPKKGEIVDLPYDFSILHEIIPHPIYAYMGWICINCTQETNLELFYKYIDLSYQKAVNNYNKKLC